MDIKKTLGIDLYSNLPEGEKRKLNDIRKRMKTVRDCSPVKNSAFDEMMREGLEKIKREVDL